jgi:hypothetical protein
MIQCPVCYWWRSDNCQDWHYDPKRNKLDPEAKMSVCEICKLVEGMEKEKK